MRTLISLLITLLLFHGTTMAAQDTKRVLRFEIETPGGPLPVTADVWFAMPTRNPPVMMMDFRNGSEQIHVQALIGARTIGYSGVSEEFEDHIRDRTDGLYWDIARLPNGAAFPEYASTLHYSLRARPVGSDAGVGMFFKQRGSEIAELPVAITEIESHADRFDREHPLDPDAIQTIDGRWVVDFASSDDEALGVFEVQPDGYATGTFLTPTGDYRFLEGIVDGRTLKLSCFDGGHAFLFHATIGDDGTLAGDFWSGNWWHETWTATPAPEGYALPDAFGLTEWTGDAGLDELVFTDLGGNKTSVAQAIEDAGGGPAVLEIFGSWCPNCHDAAVAIRDLHKKTGVTVVALAFELTDDFDRSKRQVESFMRKHEADHTVLIAGVADKGEASRALPALDRLRAYPTTVFVRADGTVAAVHTGFTGPAAPEEHARLVARFESIVHAMQEGRE